MAIPNKHKNTLDDFMDSSDSESLEVPRSEDTTIGTRPDLKRDHLDKNRRGQRNKKGHWGSKKRWVVREDSSPEANDCYQ